MKRLNPDTGKPFVRGDTRADGFLFYSYQNGKIKKDSFCIEQWLSPDAFERRRLARNADSKKQGARWRNEKRAKYLAGLKRYKKENAGVINALVAKRAASKKNRTPKWLSPAQLDEIKSLYVQAAMLTESTGVQHHVDHIIPMQGENVSGLHVPWNLQILTAHENLKKGNRHCPL